MIVDLASAPETESGWFELRDGGRVHLRLLSAGDIKAIRKACLSTTVEYPLLGGKYQRFEAQRFDEEQFESLRWDKCILGWEHLLDRAEHPIEVTAENKRLLMEHVPEFAEAVIRGLDALKEAERAKTEATGKNSSPGWSGSPSTLHPGSPSRMAGS